MMTGENFWILTAEPEFCLRRRRW